MFTILSIGRYVGALCMSTRQPWDETVVSARLRSSSYHLIAAWLLQ